MNRPEIVINVQGGVVQDAFCSDDSADLIIVDWDVEGSQPGSNGVIEVPLFDGSCNAVVFRPMVQPLCSLAGTDVEAAIEAAEESGELPYEDAAGVLP